MNVDFSTAVKSVLSKALPIACLDTCVWLELIRGRLSAKESQDLYLKLKALIGKKIDIVIPNQIQVEFNRNKGDVVRGYVSTLNRISKEYEKYHSDFLQCIDPTLILLNGDFQAYIASRYEFPVENLLNSSTIFTPLPGHYEASSQRACLRIAPSKRKQSSSADSLIFEAYVGLVAQLRASGWRNGSYFVTLNTSDFSEPAKPDLPHPEISSELNLNKIEYFSNLQKFVNKKSY